MTMVPEIEAVLALPRRALSSAAAIPGNVIDGVASAVSDQRPLEAEETRRLGILADAARATPRASTLTTARAAHATNTPAEMERALRDGADVLEGDLRVDRRGRLVMAHEPWERSGMTFHQWLAVGVRSGRILKVDVKEPEAIGPMLRMLRASGVRDELLVLNVPLGTDGATSARVGHLRLLRRHAPDATINLSNQRYPYQADQLGQLRAAADYVGGRVMFPVRSDQVSSRLTGSLAAHGRIAAWNLPQVASPTSIAAERRRLRALGVDGTIDLREGRELPLAREMLHLGASMQQLRSRVAGWLG